MRIRCPKALVARVARPTVLTLAGVATTIRFARTVATIWIVIAASGMAAVFASPTAFTLAGVATKLKLTKRAGAEGGELVLRNELVLRAEALVTVALVGSKASAVSAAGRVQQWQPGAKGVALQKHEPPHR